MKKAAAWLLLGILVGSCSFIHYMNTKPPRPKSEAEILAYLEEEGFSFYDYSFLLSTSIDSLSRIKHALDLWKYERGTEPSTIQLRVYDSLGHLVNGYTQCYGEMRKINILLEKGTRHFEHFPNNYALEFADELSLPQIPDALRKEVMKAHSEKKQTFVIYWNIWSNHFSKVIFKNLEKYLEKYAERNSSLIILINTDNIIPPA